MECSKYNYNHLQSEQKKNCMTLQYIFFLDLFWDRSPTYSLVLHLHWTLLILLPQLPWLGEVWPSRSNCVWHFDVYIHCEMDELISPSSAFPCTFWNDLTKLKLDGKCLRTFSCQSSLLRTLTVATGTDCWEGSSTKRWGMRNYVKVMWPRRDLVEILMSPQQLHSQALPLWHTCLYFASSASRMLDLHMPFFILAKMRTKSSWIQQSQVILSIIALPIIIARRVHAISP